MLSLTNLTQELQHARRIKHPREIYAHMKPLLQTLTREQDTVRTRQIKLGEDVQSLWDTVMDERNEFKLFDVQDKNVTCRSHDEISDLPHMFYNKANEAEDAILFPDDLDSDNNKSVPFREIHNGVSRIESGMLPSDIRHMAKGMEAINRGEDPIDAIERATDEDEDSIWRLPKVWETGLKQLKQEKPKGERRKLLMRTGLLTAHKSMSMEQRLKESDPMEVMERDRSFGE